MIEYVTNFFLPEVLFKTSFLYALIGTILAFILAYVIHYLRHTRKVKKMLLTHQTEEIFPDYLGETRSKEMEQFFREKNYEIERFEEELQRADFFTLDANIYYILGNYNLQKDRFQKAFEYFHKSNELAPDNAKIYFGIGTASIGINKFEEAIAAFNKALELGEDIEDCYYNIGWTLDELGKYQEAIDAYSRAYQHNPEDYWSQYNIACALAKMRQYDKAIETLREIVDREGIKEYAYNDSDFDKLKTDKEFGPTFLEITER